MAQKKNKQQNKINLDKKIKSYKNIQKKQVPSPSEKIPPGNIEDHPENQNTG